MSTQQLKTTIQFSKPSKSCAFSLMLICHPLWHIFSKKRVIKLNTLKKLGLRDAKDALIWDYAIKNGTVIITKDEDFEERLSHRPKMAPAVVWIRLLDEGFIRSRSFNAIAGKYSF